MSPPKYFLYKSPDSTILRILILITLLFKRLKSNFRPIGLTSQNPSRKPAPKTKKNIGGAMERSINRYLYLLRCSCLIIFGETKYMNKSIHTPIKKNTIFSGKYTEPKKNVAKPIRINPIGESIEKLRNFLKPFV